MRAAMLAIVAALALATPLRPQTMQGRLLDGATGEPVPWALLTLIAHDGTRHGQTLTDTAGRFSFAAPEPALYRVRIERIGYHSELSEPLDVSADRATPHELRVGFRSSALPARLLVGRVVDTQTLQPVELARVRLLELGTRRATDASGLFLFSNLAPGTYHLQIEHVAYGSRVDTLSIEAARALIVTVELAAKPIPLAPLVVAIRSATEDYPTPELRDFHKRKEQANGVFLTQNDIEEKRPNSLADVFRRLPGLRVFPGSDYNRLEMTSATASYLCSPTVYLDGVRYDPGHFNIDAVNVEEIGAIEVYHRGSTVPAQFGGGQARCGVVLLWSARVLQPPPARYCDLHAGQRVRGALLTDQIQRFTGTLLARDDLEIVLRPDGERDFQRIRIPYVTDLQISRGARHPSRKGALIGALAGSALGLIYLTTGDGAPTPGTVTLGIASGSALGGLIGALIGSFGDSESWQPVAFEGRRCANP